MANISATINSDTGTIQWPTVEDADTALEQFVKGGKFLLEVNGTFDGATVDLQYGTTSGDLVDIDTDEAPDGARFTAQGVSILEIPSGYIKPDISGGGTSQDVTITMKPMDKRTANANRL